MVDYKEEAGKYAEGLAEALVGKLGLLLLQEFHLLSRVRDEVVLLRDDAAMMNALLRMYSETDEGAVDHFVREWMTQVRELAYDGEDCMDIFISRINWAPRSTNPVLGFFHWIATLIPRHRLANDIDALRARAIAVGDRRGRYGVYGQALQPSVAFGARVPTSSVPPPFSDADHDPGQFVGMEDQIKILSEKMTSSSSTDQTLKVYSIVGTGGIGKSTLAARVLGKLKGEFDCRAVVSVSQEFDTSKNLGELVWRILEQFGYRGNRPTTVDSMKEEFASHLKDKSYIIVIDDVWTISAWTAIRQHFTAENNKGSRIIVTTRIEAVAKACSSREDYIHRAEKLGDAHAKTLFSGRVGGSCPNKLEEQMDRILKKCGGLPLAIVSIAGVLASYNSPSSIEMWESVGNSISFQTESNPALEVMMQIIALSYNHLPHHLKACAMLLSIFPEDYRIPKWRVLRRWISEGLIPEKRGLTLLDVAEAYYDEMLSRNMIQLAVLPDGTVSKGHCCVHDMMLEVILSKSLESNFASLVGSPRGGTSNDAVRRLSIHGGGSGVGRGVEGINMQHARSLTTFGDKKNVAVSELLHRLGKFTLLRVLDLEDCKDLTNKHMKQVCQLFLLRFLGLNGTNITKLPSEISKLQQLQSLLLYLTLLEVVPGSVVLLKKLEYISFLNRKKPGIFLKLPQGINQMESLQEITRLQIGKDDIGLAENIGKLEQLRTLGVFLLKDHGDPVRKALDASVAKLKSFSLRGEPNFEYEDPGEKAAAELAAAAACAAAEGAAAACVPAQGASVACVPAEGATAACVPAGSGRPSICHN